MAIDKSSQHYKEFKILLTRLLNVEAGFTADPNDLGNWTGGRVGVGILKGTKFGISAATYPDLDIKSLTQKEAEDIYYRDWWLKLQADNLPFAIVGNLWDTAINTSILPAIRMLQRAVGALDDGEFGPLSLEALNKMELNDVILLFNAERLEYYAKISTVNIYGAGWMNRIAKQLRFAAQDN